MPQVSWILKAAAGDSVDYVHFAPPLLGAAEAVFAKVRNLTHRVLPPGSTVPREITKYDPWVVRESVNNCLAHQDYAQGGRINVVEGPDYLLLTNRGAFIPVTLEAVLKKNAPEEVYRNEFLTEAMVNLNLIDTIGSGIRRMFNTQRNRSFPLPDYDLSEADRVQVRLYGQILDERFTQTLMADESLMLDEVILLDKVQKGRPIDDESYQALKKRGLVEGRHKKPYISAPVAVATGREPEYIHNRGLDKAGCKQRVIEYLTEFGPSKREKIERLLAPLLPAGSNEQQKQNSVKNLLQEMRLEGVIRPNSATKGATWELSKPAPG